MKKNVFKTFVYSFAISTLVIFSINKLPSYFPQKSDHSRIKVSNKNITSFLKEESKNLPTTVPSVSEEIIAYNEPKEDEVYDIDVVFMDVEEENSNDETLIYYIEDTVQQDIEDPIQQADLSIENINKVETTMLSENSETDDLNLVEAFAIDTIAEEVSNASPYIEEDNSWKVAGFDVAKDATQEILQEVDNTGANSEANSPKAKALIPIQKGKNTITSDNVSIEENVAANQVAMSQTNASLKGMITDEASNNVSSNNDNPWVVAKGAKFPNNTFVLDENNSKENNVVEAALDVAPKATSGEVKVAEMVRNILIPIPEDILKEGNLTPQLISSKRNKDLQEKIEQNIRERKAEKETEASQNSSENEDENNEENDKEGEIKSKKTIFDSISSIFSGKTPVVGVSKSSEDQNKFDTVGTVYTVKKDNKTKKNNKVTKILPTEIKLSFQPNRAEISGQTLKWIEAFANKTIEDSSVALEVRIDGTTSFELQQKRLSLLHNILTNKGVEYKKINTVFTTREPNSFIIRTVRINEKSVAMDSNPKINEVSKYYQNW